MQLIRTCIRRACIRAAVVGLSATTLAVTWSTRGESYTSNWKASSGLQPDAHCPEWRYFKSAGMSLTKTWDVTRLQSSTVHADYQNFTHDSAQIDIVGGPPTIVMEFSMRWVDGHTNDTVRTGAGVGFSDGDVTPRGSVFWIEQDRIFLSSAPATKGDQATVDTDDSFHTYRIEWDHATTEAIRVYYDGLLTLTGTGHHRSTWPTYGRVVWGDLTSWSWATTEWKWFYHNAVILGADGDGDDAPDDCDNCQGAYNPAQDQSLDQGEISFGDLCTLGDTLNIYLFSPVDVVVTDPILDSIGTTFNTILQSSSYDTLSDYNNDGEDDDIITIPHPIPGDYYIRIYPEAGASPGDLFTMAIKINGSQQLVPDDYTDATVSSLGTTIPDTYVWTAAATLAGDVNADFSYSSADVIYMVNMIFKGGPAPWVPGHADVDCSGAATSADIIYMVNFIFKGGVTPCSTSAIPS